MDWERASRLFSAFRVLVWLALLPLSWRLGWINSVAFVALCSLYANVASDYAAYRADSNTGIDATLARIDEKLDELLKRAT